MIENAKTDSTESPKRFTWQHFLVSVVLLLLLSVVFQFWSVYKRHQQEQSAIKILNPEYSLQTEREFSHWFSYLRDHYWSDSQQSSWTTEIMIMLLEKPEDDSPDPFHMSHEERSESGYVPREFTKLELQALEKLKALQVLNIEEGDLTLEAFQTIFELQELRELWLKNINSLQTGSLEKIPRLHSLKRVDLSGNIKLSIADLAAISKIEKQDHLLLGPFSASEVESFQCLAQARNLKGLSLTGKWVSSELIQSIPRIESLESLTLRNVQLAENGFSFWDNLPNLKYLSIENTEVSDQVLKRLAVLEQLEYLFLNSANSVTDEGVAELHALKHLEEFEVVAPLITDKALDVFRGWPKIRGIHLYAPLISEKEWKTFAKEHPSTLYRASSHGYNP